MSCFCCKRSKVHKPNVKNHYSASTHFNLRFGISFVSLLSINNKNYNLGNFQIVDAG